jgi:hypothetical protein
MSIATFMSSATFMIITKNKIHKKLIFINIRILILTKNIE